MVIVLRFMIQILLLNTGENMVFTPAFFSRSLLSDRSPAYEFSGSSVFRASAASRMPYSEPVTQIAPRLPVF